MTTPYRKHGKEHRRGGGDIAGIVVEETDGSPSVKNVTKIKVAVGDLTDNADGSVTIATGGAAGGAHALTDVNNTVSGRTAGDILVASAATTYAFRQLSGDATMNGTGVVTVAATHAGGTHAAAGSDHIADTTAAHAASAVANTPAGTVAATTVQAAIDELATDYASADSTHAGAADPHTGYRLESADHTHAASGAQAGVLYSITDYANVPDATPGATITAGDAQGAIYHSGPSAETAIKLFVDAETAPGASGLPVTWQFADTDDLDTAASWTTIATLTLSSEKSSSTTSMTDASITANRLMRTNWGTIVGTPKDATTELRAKRPLST